MQECISCKERKQGKEYNGIFMCDDCIEDAEHYAEIHRRIDDRMYWFKEFVQHLKEKNRDLYDYVMTEVRARHVIYDFFLYLDDRCDINAKENP